MPREVVRYQGPRANPYVNAAARAWHSAPGRMARKMFSDKFLTSKKKPTYQSGVNKGKGAKVNNPTSEPAAVFASVAHIKGKKKVKQTGRKRIKVSHRLREQVKEVVKENQVHGHFKQISQSFTTDEISIKQTVLNKRNFWAGGGMGVTDNVGKPDAHPSWLFTPNFFIHAASVLFRGKNSVFYYNKQSSDLFQTGNFKCYDATVNERLKFTVKSCSATYLYKNNQTSPLEVCFYVCAPRRKSTHGYPDVGNNSQIQTFAGTTGVDSGSLMDPVTYLTRAYTTDTNIGGKILDGSTLVSTSFGGNYAYTTMNVVPEMYPTWAAGYKAEKIFVCLQPGQEYKLHVQGPSNLEFDAAKCVAGTLVQNTQMYSRSVMVAVLNQLSWNTNVASNVTHGRYINLIGGEGLSVERLDEIKICMPEITGAPDQAIAAGGGAVTVTKQNNYRRPYLMSLQYTPSSYALGSGIAVTISPEQPSTIAQV